ncbi:superoxide dismutase [Mortierella sp. GBAus27b]|nr:hypothetical protein BGX31_007474 [Mortierella sp. GBA43]KAI8347251.1 superoxide dismutase [Mortierella sp. GBAus27b]
MHKSILLPALLAVSSYINLAHSQPEILVSVINMNDIQANFVFAPVSAGGVGAQVLVDVQKGLSKSFAVAPSGGFEYHIHVKPVGPNNDCMATGGHLDPANVGATAVCNPAKSEKCQEGDLSGKHGNLNATESGAIPIVSYVDHHLQFSGDTSTIRGRSVVIHNNGTRVACGNITPLSDMESSKDTNNLGSTASSPDHAGRDGVVREQSSDSDRVNWNAVMTMAGAIASAGMVGLLTL